MADDTVKNLGQHVSVGVESVHAQQEELSPDNKEHKSNRPFQFQSSFEINLISVRTEHAKFRCLDFYNKIRFASECWPCELHDKGLRPRDKQNSPACPHPCVRRCVHIVVKDLESQRCLDQPVDQDELINPELPVLVESPTPTPKIDSEI